MTPQPDASIFNLAIWESHPNAFFHTLFFSIGWLVCGVKLTLDLIGWSTAPEDTSVALGRSMLLLNWLASLPSWIPDVLAMALTMWLMFMSWPRAQTTNAVENQSAALNLAPITSPSTPVKLLSSIHYDISTAGTKVSREIEKFPGSRSMDLNINGRKNELRNV